MAWIKLQIPEWFKGARMNYAENLLRHPDDDHIAYYYTSERIKVRTQNSQFTIF